MPPFLPATTREFSEEPARTAHGGAAAQNAAVVRAVLALQRTHGNRQVARSIAQQRLARHPVIAAPPQASTPANDHVPWADQTTDANKALGHEIDEVEKLTAAAFLRERDIVALRASSNGRDHAHDVLELEAIEFVAARRGLAPLSHEDESYESEYGPIRRRNVRVELEYGVKKTGSLKKAIDRLEHKSKSVELAIWAVENDADEFGKEFNKQAKEIAKKMLAGSARAILEALRDYGFDPEWARSAALRIIGNHSAEEVAKEAVQAPGVWEGGGSLRQSDARGARPSKHRSSLGAYAANLRAQQRIVAERRKDKAKLFKHSSQLGDYVPEENLAAYNAADERFRALYQRLSVMWGKAELVHPVLASIRGGPKDLDLIDLGQLDSGDSAREMYDVLASVLPKLADIYQVHDRIVSGDIKAVSLPPVVAVTKAAMFVPEGSIRAGKVNDLAEEAQDTKVSTYIGAGLLALIILALAIPTAGASIGVGIGLMSAALSATTAVEDWREYKRDQLLSNTALDRAKALSTGDASLVPFVIDLISLGFDGAALVDAFSEIVALRKLVRSGEDLTNTEMKDAVARLNNLGKDKDVHGLGDRTLEQLRAAEHETAAAPKRPWRRPPGQPYDTPEELREAIHQRLLDLDHGATNMNSEWIDLVTADWDQLVRLHPENAELFKDIQKVYFARRDPQVIEDLMVKLYTEAGYNGLTPQKELLRRYGGPRGMPIMREDATPAVFLEKLREDKPLIDLTFLKDDHGALTHMFDEYVMEHVLGGPEKARQFRRAIANAKGQITRANGEVRELSSAAWDALFDSTDATPINRPERLGPILQKHLGFKGNPRPRR